MRTILRKLFGASTGNGACLSFFVFALTGLIAGIPLAARAQDTAVVGTVTFRDKEPDSIVADGVLSFKDLTQANGSIGDNRTNKFQTYSAVGSIDTFFSPRQTLGSGQSWTATFTATETIFFDSVHFGGILCYNANWGGVQTTSTRTNFTVTAGGVTSAPVTINWPGATTTDATMEATVSMGQTVTLAEGETLTLVADNGNNGIVSFGFSQMEFIGSGSASQTVEWVAEPEQTGKNQAAFTGGFTFRLDGLRQVGDQAPNPLPQTASLSAITVEFLVNKEDAMNQNVRHLTLTDEAGSVLAISAEADPTPTGLGTQQIVFSFPGLPELSLSTLYKGYFTATAPEIGSAIGTDSDVRTRISFYQDQTAIDVGNQVNGWPAYCLAASFSLQAEVEESLGALNINFDTNADRLADVTLYGLDGVQYPGAQWNTITGSASATDVAVTDTLGASMTVDYLGQQLLAQEDNTDLLLKAVLQDYVANGPNVQIDGIPYERYDVYVYMSSDTHNWGNSPVRVNGGDYYIMEEGQETATVVDGPDGHPWAAGKDLATVALGTTVMRIANLSGEQLTLNTERTHDQANGRGNIAAIQIVEVATPERDVWKGTLSADTTAVSKVEVRNVETGETATLPELGAGDAVSLSCAAGDDATLSLRVDKAVEVAALTLDVADGVTLTVASEGDLSIAADEIALTRGTLEVTEGALASENPVDLAEGTVCRIRGWGFESTFTQALAGAGAVEIVSGYDVTLAADFTHTGGTTVSGEGAVLRYGGHALGAVTVGQGGVFDLNGHACAQAITLNGGTLRATEAINDTVGGRYLASVNFNPTNGTDSGSTTVPDDAAGRIGETAAAGLVPAFGEYWLQDNGTPTASDLPLSFYAANAVQTSGSAAAYTGTIGWNSENVWVDDSNQTNWLKGYLDDPNQTGITPSATVTVPFALAGMGYDLYLYSSVDPTGGSTFSARDVTGDDGVTTSYSYVDGVLTAGSTAGWGSAADGRTTVAEGVNVMRLPARTDRTLTVDFRNSNGRGGLAALQIYAGSDAVGNFAGMLSVIGADSKIEVAEGVDVSFAGAIAVSGEGALSKVGAGTLTLVGAVTGDLTVDAGVLALGEADIAGAVTVNAGQLRFDAGAYAGLTVDLNADLSQLGLVSAGVADLTLAALAGSGELALTGAQTLTLAGAAEDATFSGTLSADGGLTLVKQGANAQRFEGGLPATLSVVAEGGTLDFASATVDRLETRGGTVTGTFSATAYAEMAAGDVSMDAPATASAARPAAATADAATVSNFTLVEDGELRYEEPADRNLYFPEGFIPRGSYKLVLGEAFADSATFPFSFRVLGADRNATFTVCRADGSEAPTSSYTANGPTITVWDVGAVIDYSEDLPEAKFSYTFDESTDYTFTNLGTAGTDGDLRFNANAGVQCTEEGVENGAAIQRGYPWTRGWELVLGESDEANAWTAGFYLTLGEEPPANVILWATAANGGNSTNEGSLFLATGEEPGTLTLWRRVSGAQEEVATVDLDAARGGASMWHQVLLAHSPTRIRFYVDGGLAAECAGDFAGYNQRGFQIGSYCGTGPTDTGLSRWDSVSGVKIDELTLWPAALRDVQIEKALATTTAAWRIREGETPAELFTANAPWTRTNGSSDVFAAADEDASTLTARATLSVKAGAEELFTALESFTARNVLLDGEPLSHALFADSAARAAYAAPTLPDTVGSLVVDNDLTIDLSGVDLMLAAQIAAKADGFLLLPGLWRGTLTLTDVPEGFDFSLDARDDGLYLVSAVSGSVASINFHSDNDRLLADDGVGGLVPMRGAYWVKTTGATSDAAATVAFYDLVAASDADAAPTGDSVSVTWAAGGVYQDDSNPTKYLKGYLDDNGSPSTVTLTVPEAIAKNGYDVYLYSSVDLTGGSTFSAREVTGDDGETTSYSYVDGVLTAGSTAGWGSAADGRTTVAEGVNVMRLPARTDETLTIAFRNNSSTGNGRGGLAAIQIVKLANLYVRSVEGTEAWEATGAWTSVLDGTTVDVPPEGARLMVETTDASILTVDGALPAYDSLTVVGGGTLALSVDGQSLLTDEQYKAIPRGQAHTATILDAAIDPAQVSAWVSALKYGATAAVSVTEGGITAAVTLPDAAYPASDLSESISFNFTNYSNRGPGGVGAIADDAMGASGTPYATYGAYWLEPTEITSKTAPRTETLDAPVVLNTARGAAGANTSKTASVTYNVFHGYAGGLGGTYQPILQAFANGHSLSGGGGGGGIPFVSVSVPEDWGDYTAVVYMSTDTGSPSWLPKRVNGAFYYYDEGRLATLEDATHADTVGGLPDEVKDTTYAWGRPTEDGSLVEGTNMMVIPGLSGDFKLEFWSKPNAANNNVDVSQTQGRVAAFQLIEDGLDNLPDLDAVQVYQAELAGEANWADLQWTINGQAVDTDPGAADLVELTLTGDATLTFGAATTVASITVYGQGHALRVTDAATATAAWTFLNDAILALGEGDTLPATIDVYPKRVRYDYAYAADYAATTAYETEFAAGFSGNLSQINVGFVEFSHGDVAITRMTSASGVTTTGTLVFSGDVRLTMTDDVNAAGLRIGNTDVTFRDNATATLSRIHMRGESATHSSITLEDNAAVTVTGSTNSVSNYNTLQFGDWGGTSALTLRDNARLVAAAADLMLGGTGTTADNGATVTLEDDAEMRVAGVARYNESSGAIVLNGGTFLVGSRGFRTYSPTSTSVLSVAFNGGALGAWADWTWGADTAAIVTTVSGDPILAPAQGVTLTVAEGANLLPADGNATVRGAGTVKSALSTLPALTLEGGTFESKVAAQAPSVSLSGGALALSGGALTLADGLETHGVGSVRIPLSPSGVAGWLAMADGGPVPDVSDVVFTLALDLSGEDALLPYQVPLFLGACDTADTPTIAGVMLENNAAGAIITQTPVYAAGAQGLGLYLTLSGNAVLQPHTVALDDTGDGYRATQAVADTYGYWIFDGQVAGARLLLPTDTLRFREVAFRGQPMTLVASGNEPHLLLQARGLTVNTPLTIDLSAWAGALDAFVSGAVDGLPCSLCLIAADTLTLNEVVVTLDGYEPPEGCTLKPVATDRGIYLVAEAPGRPAQALSVNFADRATALAAPPAAPGAYAVPVAAWNTLAGSFFSADLRVSDLAGVASIPAVGANGQNTQLSATAAAVVADPSAPATLIQTWLTDDAAQTVRVANIPFAKYRLALILASDYTAAAAYAPVTVGADRYAMDAEGYTRKNVLPHAKAGLGGDTAWGSTERDGLSAEDPDDLGLNTLVTDVLTAPAIDIALPRLVYGRTYAGLAALQIIEAPKPEADAGEGTAYAYTFTADAPEAVLADLDLTIEDGTTAKWQSGPENTLALTVPEGVSATLTLPLNFRAKTLSVSGAGDLTLLTESDGGILLGTLDASGLTGDLTVRCPCVGVAFTPGAGVSRFEAAFDNAGEPYTIADGATLALGADSGVAVSLDGGTTLDRADGAVTLLVDPASTGTLRRDYAESFNTDWSDTSYRNQTWAFRDLAAASGRGHIVFSPDLLIEDGDVWSLPDAGIWLQSGANHKTAATLVQTGGTVEIDTLDGANHGFLVASNDGTGLALDFDLSGGRFAASQLMGWGPNASLDLDVTGTGVLALGNGDGNYAGSIAACVASVTMDVAVTDGGVFEPLASTVSAGSAGTHALTFGPGGAIRFGSDTPAEVDMTMPVTFADTAETPTTIDPGTYGTLVLNAANTGSGALTLARGTLALANASGLGEATVTVASGAAFEARGFTGEGEASEEARTVPVVAIKLDIPAGVGNSDGTAIQEFCLYQGNDKVAWPRGTTISGSPNWAAGGNEAINALIDGVTGNSQDGGTWRNPADDSTGTYTAPAFRNKWYPITNTTGTASATITIGGDGVVFDAYTLWCSDSQNRFPTAWTLSVRYEGDDEDSWTVLHAPTGQTRPAANTESDKYRVALRTEGGATTLDAVTGKVVFASGAQCRAVRKVGVTGFPYVARIAGSIDVAKGPRYFLDGVEFAARNVEVEAGNGLVTFNEGGALEPTDVTWDTANVSGTWQDGVGGADGPWQGGATFINGAAVTFPDVTQPTVATVAGSVKPGTVTFGAGATTAYYTFAGAEDAVLDLSTQAAVNVGSTTNQYIDFAAGAGTTFDVPIATSGAGVGINLPNGAVRLVGALSDNNRTATLLGSGNLNEAGQHGVWHASGDLTLMPRAGETQRLSANSGQLYGDGTIIVQGQVAEDGSVSGGTVVFGGTAPAISNNTDSAYNNAFRGDFVVRDGATLDVAMMRGDGSVNVDDNPFFRTGSGAQDALYKRGEDGTHRTGFTLRNGGALRVGIRGLNAGWNNYTNADIVLNEAVVVGRNATYHPDFSARDVRQYMVHSLRMDGDGATLRIGGTAQGTASNRGLSLIQGSRLTVAGVGDAGDPADPAVDSALDEAGQPVDAETFGTLTRGISARIVTDDPTAGFKISEFGFDAADPNVYLDVGEGSALTIDAPLGAAAGTAFVKQGAGRLELTWPTIDNVVEFEVEEGALGGDAELTSGTVTVAADATVEAGLSVTELALENGATLALDPTGARQLRAGTVTFAAGGRYVISALSAPPTPAAGREPVKILSWSNVVDVSAAGFLVDDSLRQAGYGVEIRADGLYLAPAATYVRVLGTVVEDKDYALNWFDRAWHRADDFSTLVDYAPAANETANVVFIVPNSASSVGLRVTLDREVSFASVRFARGEFDDEGKLIRIGEQCGGTVDYVYDLTRAEMPSERETRTYAFLPSLAYFNNGTLGTATFTEVLLPDGYQCSIDGVTATVYLGSGGETGAINVSFTGGSEGSLSWIGTDTAPCGAVPFAGVYWNNASTQGGAGLESLPLATDAYKGYELKPRVSGAQAASATPTVRYAFTAGRTVAGRAGLAAGFLPGPGQKADPDEIGFIEDSGISSAGWAVRVDDIPFARYDLYLLFAGSGDGAATYPAVRVKAGTGAWRTYAFRNGWAAPAGSGDAWDGQAVLDEGFADGANLLHLRIEGGGTLQIVPHDGANGNNANVGLAALQIVEIPQGQPAYYKAAGPTWSGQTWSYAATGANGATQNVPAAAWQDATPDAPHYALLDGLTRLDADRAAALPFLRRTGSGSLELTGTAGTLSAGTLDLLEASGTVTVHEDLFVQAPNVILGDAVTLVPFPEAAADTSLAWRWVYPDDVAHTATLSKKGPYGLTLTQPVDNRLQIDTGTLWLTQAANAANYPRTISGAGTLGWAGNAFRVAFNNLPDGSADADGVFLRVASGTVTLDAVAGSSLPANGTVLIEDGGSLTFYRTAQGRTFQNGTFLARNGGCLLYEAGSKASNLFANGNEQRSQLPSVRLESGLFRQTLGADHDNGTGGSVHDVFGLTSSGLSRHYIDNAGNKCWAHKALNIHGGRIQVLDGTLALHSSLADGAASRHSVVLLPNASTTDTYGDTGSTGYLDVASGATLLSAYPIYAGNNANGTLVKVGGGIWVQAKNICQSVGYNGGEANLDQGGQDPYCNVEVRAGTLRLNGSNTFAQPSTAQSRTVTVGNGARLDGAGDFDQHFTVEIEQGGTLAAGFPADAEWATAADGWYGTWFNDFPERFTAPTTEATAITFNGGLEFEDGAVLEVDLAKAVASTNALVRVSGDSARVSLGSSLTVRLTNLQTAFSGPVRLTAFTVNPSREPTINCPEAIALDGDVRWLTDAEAAELGAAIEGEPDATVENLWLVATGDSYVWTAQSGNWSDANWTHQGATTDIVNGITAPEDAPKARVVAASADVTLIVDQDPGEPNQPDWGLHGLVLSAAQERGVTLAQGGRITGSESAPEGKLYGLRIDSSLWKVGGGTAQVDALAWLDNAATLTVDEGSLTFTRPLLRDNLSAGQGVNPLGAALSVAEGSTLTFAFAEPTDPERGYFAGLGLENPQALTLNGSFSGAGTLRVEGEGAAVTLASQNNSAARQDGALSYSVGAGATLTLQGDTPASTGDATPRTVTVEGDGTLALDSERALGATTAWTWELADGALVTTADDARIRGTVRLDAGAAATLGRDSQQWDGDLTAEVGAGATLTFTGNIQTPEDAPAAATFAKRGAGTAVIDDAGYFSPGLHVDVAEGTLRVEGTLSVTPGERGVTPAWTVRDGATLALGGGTCNFSDGSLTVEGGGVLDCAANVVTLNNSSDRPTVLADGATLRFGDGTGLNEGTALTVRTALRVEGRVAVEVAVDNPAGLRLSEYPLIAFDNSARQGTGTFVLGGANVTALSAAGWTLEDRGADGVYLVAFGNGQNYVWAGTAAGWLDGDAWVYNGASTPTTWVDGTSQGAVTFLDRQPIGQVDVPGQYRTVGSTGTQQVTALRSENSGGDYALDGTGGLTVQGLLLKVGASGLTFRRPVTFGNGGAINVQEGTVTFADTLGSTDNPAALLAPVTLGQGATLAFSGNKARTLSGDFDAAEGSTLAVSGGALTLAGDVTGLGSLRAEGQGTNVALTAPGQALALDGPDAPTFALGTGATLTLGGDLPGGGTVAPKFDAATQGATLRWEGVASVESGSVPRLDALGGAVSTLVYAPRAGHLILDPGSLMDGAALSLENDDAETTALWLGAGDGTVEEAIRLSALTASGAACVGVEPERDLAGAAWAAERTLTLALSGDAAFGGTFMGAADAQGDIRAGLTLEKADPDAAGTPTFTYSGQSTDGTVGTLTAKGVRVAVTGEWAGAATAEDGGVLGGSGTLGAVTLGAGGALSANAADVRGELAPATLTLGSLELGAGAGLEVLARVDEASGATNLSLVQVAGTCRLGANDLALNVYLDLEEGAAVNTRKILGWDTLDGYQSVSATVYVRGADGAWQESGDYFVRRGDDGLYLHRASARFWMILR